MVGQALRKRPDEVQRAQPPGARGRAPPSGPAPEAVGIRISGGLREETSIPQSGMEIPGPSARCPVQEQRARWERKRACTARELLETERRYQEQLGLVATVRAGHPPVGGGDRRVWQGLCEVGDQGYGGPWPIRLHIRLSGGLVHFLAAPRL